MFVLFWLMLMVLVGEPSASLRTQCVNGLCITVEEEVSAEAGLCLVIPCSVSGFPFGLPRKISWFKCGSPQECDDPVMLFSRRDGFNERQALIDYDPISQNCSIIMNDLTESDSGSYFSFFRGKQNSALQGMTIAVKALSQKPTVMVPPLTEGQRATLTCRAPGRCSGSDPEITWKWTGRGNEDSYLIGNITSMTTDKITAGTFTHTSTLMFEATASQHLSNVTCKVTFKNNISTEETVTLTINTSPKILNTSGCGIQSDILTCMCTSQGVPIPTISWPLLTNHTEYFIITTASDSTVNSSISLSVTDYSHTVLCVSNNGAGRVTHNLNVLRTSNRENGAVQCRDSDSVLPWSVAAVSLIVCVVSVICTLRLWKAGQKTRAKNEDSTYMSLQKTHPPSEYDVIHQL